MTGVQTCALPISKSVAKNLMKERKTRVRKRKQKSGKIVALVLTLIFAFSVPVQEAHAEEAYLNGDTTMKVTVTNMSPEYSISDVKPITTMFDCEIIMAFKMDEGLCMSFTTSCIGTASVIGVKDIKVQQKMWYGWKTVLVSDGTESYDCSIFGANLKYPEAIKDRTYRVICTHYADVDGYEEVVNDTGAFKFTY